MIKTVITVQTLKDGKPANIKTTTLPTDNPKGFHGEIVVKFKDGVLVHADSFPEKIKESLFVNSEG